jgi:hypothetical protein
MKEMNQRRVWCPRFSVFVSCGTLKGGPVLRSRPEKPQRQGMATAEGGHRTGRFVNTKQHLSPMREANI